MRATLIESMNIKPTYFDSVTTLAASLHALSSPIDSYLEEHILASQFYELTIDDVPVGHAAVHEHALLTQFYLAPAARRHGQAAYRQVVNQLGVKRAYVPTCDECFLSHALDSYTSLEKQAYFFVEAGALGRPEPALRYRAAKLDDIAALETINIDFLDKLEQRIPAGEVYVGHDGDDLVALGVIERGRLLRDCASIGMLTAQAHRKRGIGEQTLRHMRGVAHALGLRPIAGCWYLNHASKRTLEAAGMVTATRLLNITI